MAVSQLFDEVRVYDGFAERTGVRLDRASVHRSAGVCRSVSELTRKARASGDGIFYLPIDLWPADMERIEVRRPWQVISSHGPEM